MGCTALGSWRRPSQVALEQAASRRRFHTGQAAGSTDQCAGCAVGWASCAFLALREKIQSVSNLLAIFSNGLSVKGASAMKRSVLSVFALIVFSVCAHAQQNYDDPQSRFHVRAPAGWLIDARGDSYVSIQLGGAYTDILFEDLPQAQAAAEDVVSQIQGRWTNYQQITSSNMTLGGKPASFILGSGTNNRGTTMILEVVAASLGNESVDLVAKRVPRNESGFRRDSKLVCIWEGNSRRYCKTSARAALFAAWHNG